MFKFKKIGLMGIMLSLTTASSYADDGFTVYSPSAGTLYGSDGSTTQSLGESLIHRDSSGETTIYNRTSTGLIGDDLSSSTNVGDKSKVTRDSQGNIGTCISSGNSVICN